MYGNNAYSLYQQNSVSVESPVKLVEMLYEGILRFCAQAKRHMEAEDIEKKNLLYQSHDRYIYRAFEYA